MEWRAADTGEEAATRTHMAEVGSTDTRTGRQREVHTDTRMVVCRATVMEID